MITMTFSYDPTKIKEYGKDRMRFELGDVFVDGGADSCVLSDEEYTALLCGIGKNKRAWLYAKLSVLESIMFKLSYQVDTKIDVLHYGFGERADRWRKMYIDLDKKLKTGFSAPKTAKGALCGKSYFYNGMHGNTYL